MTRMMFNSNGQCIRVTSVELIDAEVTYPPHKLLRGIFYINTNKDKTGYFSTDYVNYLGEDWQSDKKTVAELKERITNSIRNYFVREGIKEASDMPIDEIPIPGT